MLWGGSSLEAGITGGETCGVKWNGGFVCGGFCSPVLAEFGAVKGGYGGEDKPAGWCSL